MDITPVLRSGFQLIQAYGDTGFTIADAHYEGCVLVLAEATTPLEITRINELDPEKLTALLEKTSKPEIMLIGTGKHFLPMPPALKNYFREHAIGSDAMDTGAACRTFNVLLAEGRRVAAILFPVA